MATPVLNCGHWSSCLNQSGYLAGSGRWPRGRMWSRSDTAAWRTGRRRGRGRGSDVVQSTWRAAGGARRRSSRGGRSCPSRTCWLTSGRSALGRSRPPRRVVDSWRWTPPSGSSRSPRPRLYAKSIKQMEYSSLQPVSPLFITGTHTPYGIISHTVLPATLQRWHSHLYPSRDMNESSVRYTSKIPFRGLNIYRIGSCYLWHSFRTAKFHCRLFVCLWARLVNKL